MKYLEGTGRGHSWESF